MSKIDLGAVTAYADAVSQGYTGTREQFGKDQAEFAKNAAQVAANLKASEKVLAEQVEAIYAAAEVKKQEISDIGTVLVGEQSLTASERARVLSNLDAARAIAETASGERIALTDASDQHFRGLTLYGKSVQDGIPTPDAPVDIVSAGYGGNITVTVGDGTENAGQTLIVSTPEGLPGIPVQSGGNYTDADGQQWICDELDFARGVYINRIAGMIVTGNETFSENGATESERTVNIKLSRERLRNSHPVLCNYVAKSGSTNSAVLWKIGGTVTYTPFVVKYDRFPDIDSFKSWLAELYAAGTPMCIIYPTSDIIETPLSETTLEAYRALHTNKPHTTIFTDGNAGISVEYAADTKAYIDKKFEELYAKLSGN